MRYFRRFVITVPFLMAMAAATARAEASFDAEPNCSLDAGHLPSPSVKPGTPNPDIPIEHVLVIMQENHSFDNFFGRLNRPDYYGAEVDGVLPGQMSNPDANGKRIPVYRAESYCLKDTNHSWNGSHEAYNGGLNDGFVKVNGKDGHRAMTYYEPEDMPYNYELANQFAIGDRFFSAVLGPTFPNRYFLLTGTAFGHIKNDWPNPFKGEWKQKTIFEQLNEAGITWKYYFADLPVMALFMSTMSKNLKHVATIGSYYRDLQEGKLPQVVFIESSVIMGDEHPPFNFQVSQYYVAKRINALMKSRYWKKSALFLTYDEGGGYYDHVAPPKACIPDDIKPRLDSGSFRADYDRLGFRVPFVAISPFAKRHHVSHTTYDHTSILKFIETKFNVPALTRRDANANDMLDLFDFRNPNYKIPALPKAKVNFKKFMQCFNPFRKKQKPPELEQLEQISRELGLVAQAGEEDAVEE